jgi:hypothetical protein
MCMYVCVRLYMHVYDVIYFNLSKND